jgi:ElaB/YqjD/DUF883 family membrane-anchored ribosome-binding protein
MTTRAESSKSLVEIELPKTVFSSFHKAKDFLTEAADTLKETTQQAKESLAETAGKAVDTVTVTTDKAVDTVTATVQQGKDSLTATTQEAADTLTTVTSDSVKTITATAKLAKTSLGETIEQAKGSLDQTLQTPGQLSSKTSEAIQTAINSSVSDWLQAHPVVFRLVQLLLWAANHPIISLIILLFAVAIAWSLIKAIGRLIEIAGLSLLQAPFKLSRVLIGVSAKSLGKFGGVAVKQLLPTKTTETPILQDSTSKPTYQDKQQRLAEISTRLEAIQNEQNELLQEAAAILASDKIDNAYTLPHHLET